MPVAVYELPTNPNNNANCENRLQTRQPHPPPGNRLPPNSPRLHLFNANLFRPFPSYSPETSAKHSL